jgi:hypothetical protein
VPAVPVEALFEALAFLIVTPEFQTNFLFTLTQVNFFELTTLVAPSLEQLCPAFTAA